MAGSNMVIFMLDVTNEASLQNLKYWIETVNQHNPERQIPGMHIHTHTHIYIYIYIYRYYYWQ